MLEVRPATMREWDDAWTSCPYATYFQSRPWYETWQAASSGRIRPCPLRIRFEDGTSIIFPAASHPILKGWQTRILASPGGTYGGWLHPRILPRDQAERIVHYLLDRKWKNLFWRVNPFDSSAVACFPSQGITGDTTQGLDLTPGFESVFQGFRKHCRGAVRKARSLGVIITMDDSEAAWKVYVELYRESLERWGDRVTYRYQPDFFQTLRCDTSFVHLWTAIYENRIVAAAICLYSRNHVAYWHGAMTISAKPLQAMSLLLAEAIRDAADRGFEWFDFCPSHGLDSVIAFKKRFGSQVRPAPFVEQWSRIAGFIRKLRALHSSETEVRS